jgi:hypothetical protein
MLANRAALKPPFSFWLRCSRRARSSNARKNLSYRSGDSWIQWHQLVFCESRPTILREAEEAMFAADVNGHKEEFLDSLYVMEAGMRHFYSRAMAARAIKAPAEIIDKNLEKAVAIAEKIAPYLKRGQVCRRNV